MAQDHQEDDVHDGGGHDHAGHDHAGHDHGPAEPTPVDDGFRPLPAAGLQVKDVDGELLVLDPRTDRLHMLDRVATVIWNVLDGEVTVEELSDDLADAFEIPVHTVRNDLDNLVRSLHAAALLDGVEPPAHLLVGTDGQQDPVAGSDEADGLWRPDYLRNPPAP